MRTPASRTTGASRQDHVEVHTYRLGEHGSYVETGMFQRGDRLSDPTLQWAAFEVDDLLR